MSNQEERDAVEHLYATFRPYRLRRQLSACPCCVGPDDHRRLQSKPLRALTGDDLRRYAWKAMTTWGDEEDFKHFLPRLLELLALASSGISAAVLLNKLSDAGWERWPECEQGAVRAYLIALGQFVLASFPPPEGAPDPVDYLMEIEPAVPDHGPFLDILLSDPSEGAVRLLARLVTANGWDVPSWLRDPATAEALEQAFFRYASEPFADELAEAADRLDWAQRVRNAS